MLNGMGQCEIDQLLGLSNEDSLVSRVCFYRKELLKAMDIATTSDDGWPDSRTKAETGILRKILKDSGHYDPALDRVREFDIFRALLPNYSPAKNALESIPMRVHVLMRVYRVLEFYREHKSKQTKESK